MSDTQEVTELECKAIRQLEDFDLTMFVSEIHDHGWALGRCLLRIIPKTKNLFSDIDEIHHTAQALISAAKDKRRAAKYARDREVSKN
jgi:hypothetical protein